MALTSAEIQQVLDAIAALGKKIDGLPTATDLDGVTWLELLQDGVSKKVSPDLFADSGTYTPTFSGESGGAATAAGSQPWKYIRVGDMVSVTGVIICQLSGGNDSGEFLFDLPIEPDNDWSNSYQISGNSVIQTVSGFTHAEIASFALTADRDTPSKNARFLFNLDSSAADASVVISFELKYPVAN